MTYYEIERSYVLDTAVVLIKHTNKITVGESRKLAESSKLCTQFV